MEKLAYFLLSECSNLEADVTSYGGKSVLQLGLPINKGLSRTLLLRGAASPYTSEDDDMNDEVSILYIFSPKYFNLCIP